MKILLKAVAALILLSLAVWAIRSDTDLEDADAAPLPAPARGDGAWRRAALWNDGKAEFCAYDVTWARYGHRYGGRALLILVKEPWAPNLDVKADRPRRDGFEVMKLNHVRDVATGLYTYHQMASVYTRRDTGALQKLAATSSEACGISTAEMVRGRLDTRSYFDGQGDRAKPWPVEALPEDGLPGSLRDYVAGPAPPTLQVFPTFLTGRFGDLKPVTYNLDRKDGPRGTVEIRLTQPPSALLYVFEKKPPHRLVRFEREDGTVYKMAKCERLKYWEMHEPGDGAWLPPARALTP